MTTEAQEPRTSAEIGGMGHSVKRKEDPRFIQGRGEYIDDVNLPGQLWLDIVRSPYAHAKILSIDASEALKVPGVAAVVTGKDLEGYGLHWMPALAGGKQGGLAGATHPFQRQGGAAAGCRPPRATSRPCCRSTPSSSRARRSPRSSRRRVTRPPTAGPRSSSI